MICPDCGVEFDPVDELQDVCDVCAGWGGYDDGEAAAFGSDPEW